MADVTIAGLSTELVTPGANDWIGIWDIAAGQYKKIKRSNLVGVNVIGGGSIDLGGFTLQVPASGVAALLGSAQTFTAKQTLAAGATSGAQASTADDAAFSITAPSNVGVLVLMVANLASAAGAVAFRCQSGFAAQAALIASAAGTILATAVDTVLTGTTGTDGKITVSPNAADNKIYVENRSGGARVFSWFFITN
jgi:hypothetical protein